MEQFNQMELALGTRSRSGEQYDIWEAVYSPVGDDGYPQRIFDKKTGASTEVAAHWRDHYDIGHILHPRLGHPGPEAGGKLHIYVGNMDTYYLDRSVRLLEERLRGGRQPEVGRASSSTARATATAGAATTTNPNFARGLTYHERFIPRLVKHFLRTAPQGADTEELAVLTCAPGCRWRR